MSDTAVPATPTSGAAKEPLVTVGSITAGVVALIALLVSFGIDLSDRQTSAILGVIAVLAPFVVTLVGRTKVWSPATVRAAILQAKTDATASRRTMPYTKTTDVHGAGSDL